MTTLAPRTVATRTEQLATVHIQAAKLGLETRPGKNRYEYENILAALTGKRSLRRASRAEREAVIAFFDECVAEHDARTRHIPEYVSDEMALQVLG